MFYTPYGSWWRGSVTESVVGDVPMENFDSDGLLAGGVFLSDKYSSEVYQHADGRPNQKFANEVALELLTTVFSSSGGTQWGDAIDEDGNWFPVTLFDVDEETVVDGKTGFGSDYEVAVLLAQLPEETLLNAGVTFVLPVEEDKLGRHFNPKFYSRRTANTEIEMILAEVEETLWSHHVPPPQRDDILTAMEETLKELRWWHGARTYE